MTKYYYTEDGVTNIVDGPVKDCWVCMTDPTEEEIAFWTDIFETHRRVVTQAKKPKARAQVVRWLQNPHLDSAEYKLWGNGVALPCVWFVLAGIVYCDQLEG